MRSCLAGIMLLMYHLTPSAAAEPERCTVAFSPLPDKNTPSMYHLEPHKFDFELTRKTDLPVSGMTVKYLTFPSPIETIYPENNTVHAEYYRPKGKGPFPGVIILDILDGSQVVSRGIASVLAANGIAGLCVQMPYYGPRRPAETRVRLLSPDVPHTLAAIQQAVLDNRCAAAWLASRPEVDAKKLGIHGTSLGSFVAAVTAAAAISASLT